MIPTRGGDAAERETTLSMDFAIADRDYGNDAESEQISSGRGMDLSSQSRARSPRYCAHRVPSYRRISADDPRRVRGVSVICSRNIPRNERAREENARRGRPSLAFCRSDRRREGAR